VHKHAFADGASPQTNTALPRLPSWVTGEGRAGNGKEVKGREGKEKRGVESNHLAKVWLWVCLLTVHMGGLESWA